LLSETETTWKQKRARLARLSQDFPPDDPQVVETRWDLMAQRLEEHVREVVAKAPPLTPEQRDRIAAILRGGAA
jgi:hypothetical protein